MAEAIKMPQLGSDMTEGTLLNWTKRVGDSINPGDVIAEIETDKTTVEVPAETGGVILQLIGSPGDTVAVGSVIGYVGATGEQAPGGEAAQPSNTPAGSGAKAGAQAAPAPAAGNGAEVRPGAQATQVSDPTPPPSYGAKPADLGEDEHEGEGSGNGHLPDGVKASPVARNLAAQRGVDLRQVQGTGPGGRIVKSDVESFVPPAAPAPAPAAPAPAGIAAPSYGELPSGPDVEIIDTSKLRARIARRMIDSKQQVPHFYVTSEIDSAALMALRQQLNANVPDEAKVTVNDLIVKAAALALREFPNLNSHFYGDKIVHHKRINIGIAVALPNGGLVNVVAHDADKVSIGTLAQQNKAMIARARDGRLKPDDMQGSTFTVSNLGAYDVEHFLAIINPPEAGILAVGSARKVPVVLEDGTLGIGNRMKVTVSVDHRVSDGAEGAQFMQAFKELIETPMRLLL